MPNEDPRIWLKAKGFIRNQDGSYSKLPAPGNGLMVPTAAAPKATLPIVREGSPLEKLFDALWASHNGPELKREAALIPGRLFRVDFLHEQTKTVIEVQGFKDHTSAKGFKRDNEKFLLLGLMGYQVMTLDRSLITDTNIVLLISYLVRKKFPCA